MFLLILSPFLLLLAFRFRVLLLLIPIILAIGLAFYASTFAYLIPNWLLFSVLGIIIAALYAQKWLCGKSTK